MKINVETTGWSRRYQTALRRYLKQGASASLLPAARLGKQAVALGLETLDLALIHEQGLLTLASPRGSSPTPPRLIARAKRFFAEAVVPIEKTHPAALKDDVRVNQLTQTLRQRTKETSASTRHLEQSVSRRESAEAAVKKSGEKHTRLAQESASLQKNLRDQTRGMLSAQEEERHKTSLHLQDEIAQTLLAINIGLLALKASAKVNTDKLGQEIADTQRLVRDSLKRINRCSHEFASQNKKR